MEGFSLSRTKNKINFFVLLIVLQYNGNKYINLKNGSRMDLEWI